MAVVVIMPRQGQSVESCIVTGLYKKKGDPVKKGDILFSYETDKASFEEESPADGVILELFYNEGDEVPVLENMLVIGEPGEDISSLVAGSKTGNSGDTAQASPAGGKSPQPAAVPAGGAAGPPPVDTVTISPAAGSSSAVAPATAPAAPGFISPRARKLAGDKAVDTAGLAGSGPGGRVIERDVQALLADRPRMTALARKVAAEQGTSPLSPGTGLAGTTRASDLPGPVRIAAAASPVSPAGTFTGQDFEDRKLSNTRKLIARSMHASLQNSAQLTHHLGADARVILALREKVKAMLGEGSLDTNITLNDMACFAVIKALKKFPAVNTHFLGETIRYFNKVHLGLAVDTERGLMVPSVRDAGDLSITGLSNRMKEVAAACRKGSVNPDILSPEAATFTVSNLGNYGVEVFTPVINLPQSAILGVNTILPRPKDLGGGVYAFVPHVGLSLTYDHRSLDGGEATRFLKQVATEIETLQLDI